VIFLFHKIKNITPLDDYVLLAHFVDGSDRTYDLKPLINDHEAFQTLKNTPGLYRLVKVDTGGYGIVWNEDIDLDAEEIWVNGKPVTTAFTGLIAMSDATVLWGLNESTLRKAIVYGKLVAGVDAFNFGNQWVVTSAAMEREYRPAKE